MSKTKIPPSLTKDENGNVQICFDTEDVKKWKNIIPQDLIDGFFDNLEHSQNMQSKIQEFRKKNPNSSNEEMAKELFGIPKILTKEESEKLRKDEKFCISFHNFLIENWSSLEKSTTLEISDPLFNNIDSLKEFGIVRFIADQMNHLPNLLENMKVEQSGSSEYTMKASKELDKKEMKTIVFNHPITAPDQKTADDLAEKVKEKLMGIRHKMWQACWLYANEIKKTQFAVSIYNLMKVCYPNRESDFSSKEKEEFYEELRLLRLSEFTLTYVIKEKTKSTEYKYNIPILRVGGSMGEEGDIDKVYIDLCAITPSPNKRNKKEKMAFVAAPIKKKTLELNAQDCQLAFYLQIKKNQQTAGDKKREKESPFYDFTIEQLIECAGLNSTYNTNRTMGRKRLLEKLERSINKEIVSSFEKIDSKRIRIWW